MLKPVRYCAVCAFAAIIAVGCNLSTSESSADLEELRALANQNGGTVTANNPPSSSDDDDDTPTTTAKPSTGTASKPTTGSTTSVVNNNTALRSSGGVLTIPDSINRRVVRAQVIHTRNGYHPAFDVSGVKGAGVANGFQWINYGWNASGVYNAGKPLSAFPKGKLGGAVWLVSGDRSPPFSSHDGNLVVSE